MKQTKKQRQKEIETAPLLHQKNSDNESIPGPLVSANQKRKKRQT
jgi:hypothetical protein